MMRLEKILYEKAINTNLLGRARTITKPKGWFTSIDKYDNHTIVWPGSLIANKITKPFYQALASLEYKTTRNMSKEQGIPLESYFALKEEDWRRGVLAEHMKRENLHPFVLMQHRTVRGRYWKVDKYQPGFEVPDFILEETHGNALLDNLAYAEGIQNLMFEYRREMIPTTYMFRSRWVVLDLFLIHGLVNRENWNRLFFNEDNYHKEAEIIQKEKQDVKDKTDMTKPENQAQFKAWMESQIKKFPGYYTAEGSEFDYETYFRNHSILNGFLKPGENLSKEELETTRDELRKKKNRTLMYEDKEKGILRQDFKDEEVVERPNTVGIKMPEELTPMKYKAWMA